MNFAMLKLPNSSESRDLDNSSANDEARRYSKRYVARNEERSRDALQVAKVQHSCLSITSSHDTAAPRMVELKNPLCAISLMAAGRALFALRKALEG